MHIMIAKNYFYLRKENAAMSEINNLVDQMIVNGLKQTQKVDIGTQTSDYMLKDVRQLLVFKMEMEKMEIARLELESKIKKDEQELKLRREEFEHKVKFDEENLSLKETELADRFNTETEKIKLQREELDHRMSNDKETLEIRREELNQKSENDKNRLMLERVRSLREQLEKEVYSKNQNRNEIAKITVDLVKTLLVCIGTAKVAGGVLAVEEVGVVRSKAFPLIGNLLGRIR